MKKNIFLIIPDLRCGGAEKVFINLANEWIKKSKVTFILMNQRGEMLKEINPEIEIINLKAVRIRDSIKSLIKIFKKYDNSYFISAMWPLNSVVLFCSLLGNKSNKFYITEHVNLSKSINIDFHVPKFFLYLTITFTYIWAKKIICVSNGVKADVNKYCLFNIKNKLVTIYNPIINSLPNLSEKKNKKIRLLTVGTLKKQKNHNLIMNSFALLDDKKKYHLDIVGDGPLKRELIKTTRILNIDKFVTFHGHQSNVGKFYKNSNIFILSSIYEGFGNVLVEALNYGLKVISTDCQNGPREILGDNKYGLLIPINDVNALKNSIQKIQNIEFNQKILQARSKKFDIKLISKIYLKEMGI